MGRYNRINLDGKSLTETGIVAASVKPGTVVEFDSAASNYKLSTTLGVQLFVVNTSGESISSDVEVTTDESGLFEVVTSGRVTAALATKASALKHQTPLKMGSEGLEVATLPADATSVIAYSLEEYTVDASAAELVKVRWK